MLTRPAVSVIVPVYNVQNYLGKALSSLKKQSLKNLEFICINDGSKDKSLEILENFAKRDGRFKIINQKNQGPGVARNNGLKINDLKRLHKKSWNGKLSITISFIYFICHTAL